jgi:hypothetical protein|tara:strand:+ start:410 stop:667 length:258 start_codon:yes stop_codon:yes gene_type:complete
MKDKKVQPISIHIGLSSGLDTPIYEAHLYREKGTYVARLLFRGAIYDTIVFNSGKSLEDVQTKLDVWAKQISYSDKKDSIFGADK